MVSGFISQLIEHHEAMLMLIRAGKVGSAFALARSPVEGMYRGLWISFAATDIEIALFPTILSTCFTISEEAVTPKVDARLKIVRKNGLFSPRSSIPMYVQAFKHAKH